jgi:hypothetical protein
MALGFGSLAASRANAGPLAPGSRASIGEPWEMNRLGNIVDSRGLRWLIFGQLTDLNLI